MQHTMNETFIYGNSKQFMARPPETAQNVRMQIGDKLKQAARLRAMSDAEVARRLGFSPERYGNYARGRNEPDLDTLIAICRVLQVSPAWVLGLTDDVDGDESVPYRIVRMVSRAIEEFQNAKRIAFDPATKSDLLDRLCRWAVAFQADLSRPLEDADVRAGVSSAMRDNSRAE